MAKKIKVNNSMTKLEKRVARIINNKVDDLYPLEAVIKDLMHGGCASGMIGELIYTVDCVRFYKRYGKEIDQLVMDLVRDTGCEVHSLISNWETEDPFAKEDWNQTLLAWVGFEETARNLAYQNGIEI